MISWPVIYVEKDLDEELFVITHENWFHDVDTRHAIGPFVGISKSCFFVDIDSSVFRLVGKGMSHGVPAIEIGDKIIAPEMLGLVYRRARKWDGIESDSVKDIITQLLGR